MNLIGQLQKFLKPVYDRLRMLVQKSILVKADDSKSMQLCQLRLLKNETIDLIERIQNYGFTSNPKEGAETLVLFLNGNRDHGVAVCVDDTRYRLKNLPEGGVAIYDHDGNYVKLTEANGIEIEAPNQNVNIKASNEINIGNTSLKKLVNEEFQNIFNNHVHNYIDSVGPPATPTPKATSGPGLTSASASPSPGQGGSVVIALFGAEIGNNELTSKVKAE